MQTFDLNADLGEGFGPWAMGDDTTMLSIVSSANIACGGHASDPDTMLETLKRATDNGVSIGAHPGYNDPLGFGRRVIPMKPNQIENMVAAQIGALSAVAALVPTTVTYVKPHGALANLASTDLVVANAIVNAVKHLNPNLAILAISGLALEKAARSAGLRVFSEIFADRGYRPDGVLVPRGQDGAMIDSAKQAANRLVDFYKTGLMPVVGGDPIALKADSICVHGDGPEAVEMARDVRAHLEASGLQIKPFMTK